MELAPSGAVAKVVVAKVGPTPQIFHESGDDRWARNAPWKTLGIKCHVGSIMKDIQAPKEGQRQKMFVLPSQLNAAEYSDRSLSKQRLEKYGLADYVRDSTGGPRGQLSVDLGAATFILENASSVARPDQGINNVLRMGVRPEDGVHLENGYLVVKSDADAKTFCEKLPEMTVMGIRNIPVRGISDWGPGSPKGFIDDANHTVDLVYASAVPFDSYGNSRSENVRAICQATLFGQYTGALRIAIDRGACDVFLMPLGGGVFNNRSEDIKSAIGYAYHNLKKEIEKADVKVWVLAWERNPAEQKEYQ